MHAAGHCCHFQDRNNDDRTRTFTTRNHRLKVRFVCEYPPDIKTLISRLVVNRGPDLLSQPTRYGREADLFHRHWREPKQLRF